MDVTKIPLLSGLAARLHFLAARTNVIAENIANADTPDYTARDVKPADFSKMARTAAMRASDPRHMQAKSLSSATIRVEPAPDGEASLNGNQVSIETQTMKLSETRMDYALASSLYRKGLNMLRIAVRGGN
ncbi:MAG: flagellar basal body rod protein FlgB [Parvularculaceae bacterium]